ncbi:MAG: hypothetical protein KDE22_08400 [Rhodobacterales bacterium]|nr:hypothetical protein [Rhodobacterales bacterium]
MEDSPLRYDRWIEDALRGVLRRALRHTADHGLPGDHHFYITFRTDDPNAKVPGPLKAQHPEEMTIVIQHQYWELEVREEAFSVTLSFGGRRQNLVIPFEAVTGFADPSVNFGLQLKVSLQDIELEGDELDGEMDLAFEAPINGDDADAGDDDGAAADDDGAAKTGEVIALDAFRKK